MELGPSPVLTDGQIEQKSNDALLSGPLEDVDAIAAAAMVPHTSPPLSTAVLPHGRGQKELLVYEFSADAVCAGSRFLRRLDLLSECRQSIKEYKHHKHSVLRKQLGVARLSHHSLHHTAGDGGATLQARDLRLIDDSFGLDSTPALLARKYCVLFHLKPIHAIILPRKVLVFPEEGADGELEMIIRQLRSPPDDHHMSTIPFEYKALEVLLQTVVDSAQGVIGRLESVAAVVSSSYVRGTAGAKEFGTLRDCREELGTVRGHVKAVCKVLSDVIDSEADLSLMKWPFESMKLFGGVPPSAEGPVGLPTAAAGGGSTVSPPLSNTEGTSGPSDDDWRHAGADDAAQQLLESYLADLEGVLARVKLCREGLDDTEHQYTLVLGSRRNMMMRLNAFMASTMMFTAIFSLIPGWFGTNFDSIQFVTSFNGMAILTGCGILLSSFLSYLILSRII